MTKLPLAFELNLGDAPAATSSVAQGQSRAMSFVEALANVWVGYGVAVLTQVLVFPLFGLSTTLAQNLQMGAVFTAISIIRSFALRRLFEAIRIRTWRHQT